MLEGQEPCTICDYSILSDVNLLNKEGHVNLISLEVLQCKQVQ